MKFQVEFREVIFKTVEVEAEDLTQAKELIIQAREEAGVSKKRKRMN